MERPIYVTSPEMPDYNDFMAAVKELWGTRMLTNNGMNLKALERAIGDYLGEKYVSVYTNGTLPLMAACHALELEGEVITTPYTFIATAHALKWCGLSPVFVDVDPLTGNLDPNKIEAAITEKTSAILPVHVYGRPCDVTRIKEIADCHNLKVIYDGAHAFGVRIDGKSITSAGNLMTLSFHATKVFNTLEGGAIICRDEAMKRHLDRLRNFGFMSETCVKGVGMNAKMDEMRALYGLLNLQRVDDSISSRQMLAEVYQDCLGQTKDLTLPSFPESVRSNWSHYPVLFKDLRTREFVYESLKRGNIFARRYFYPLVTDFAPYDKSAGAGETPVAKEISDKVLCLPLHTSLNEKDVERISEAVIESLIAR